MKTLRSLLCFLLLMSASVFSGNAQTLTREQAQALASEFLAQGTRATRSVSPTLAYQWDSRHLSPVATIAAEEAAPAFYAFARESGEGFVIISSDANNPRVLGYSLESSLPSVDNIPDGMRDFLTEYSVAPAKTVQSRASYNETTMGKIIVNLNTAPWGQRTPFNKFCAGGTVATGCVPTAYSILMYYHKWPLCATEKTFVDPSTGKDPITLGYEYDWANMLHSYSGTYTEKQADAVATLMRDFGYANGVAYGAGGSGGNESATTLVKYFKYKSNTPYITGAAEAYVTGRDLVGSDETWKKYIKQSLDAGLPIPYSSTAGKDRHIFILDGYTDNGYYHFNWGWNGNGNGWFTLSDMSLDDGSNYSNSHKAYFMLSPNRATYTISVTTDNSTSGTVTATCGNQTGTELTVDQDAKVTLTALPSAGYVFQKWTCNDEDIDGGAILTVTATANATYKAIFVKTSSAYQISVSADATQGSASVQVDGGESSQSVYVAAGRAVTLTATPKEGYEFVNWTCNDQPVSTSATYSFTPNSTAQYVANFAIKTYTITVASSNASWGKAYIETSGNSGVGTGTGTGSYPSSITVNHGEQVTIVAMTTSSATKFINWTLNEAIVGTTTSMTITASADAYYIAKFSDITQYTISASANDDNLGVVKVSSKGIVKNPLTVDEGANVLLYAEPKDGCRFVSWTLDSKVVSRDQEYYITASKTANYVANFEQIQTYTVSVYSNDNNMGTAVIDDGSATGTPSKAVTEGGTLTLKATANPGYKFVKWTCGTTDVSTNPIVSVTVNAANEYVAVFAELSNYTVNISSNNAEYGLATISDGTNSSNSSLVVQEGSTVTLEANANAGYSFRNWTRGQEIVSNENPLEISVTESADYVANFKQTSGININVVTLNGGTSKASVNNKTEVSADINDRIELVATPADGYYFVEWQVGTEVVSKKPTFVTSAQSDRTYIAVFAVKDATIKIEAKGSGGYRYVGDDTSNSMIINSGNIAKFRAVAADDTKKFLVWTKGNTYASGKGTIVTNKNPYLFEAYQNTALYVNFVDVNTDLSRTVTALATPGGTATVTAVGTGNFTIGEEVEFVATPINGYKFINWTNGTTTVSTEPYYTTVVADNMALTANFEEVSNPSIPDVPTPEVYDVSVSVEGTNGTATVKVGDGLPATSVKATAGAQLTLAATPITGYRFVKWTCNGIDVVGAGVTYIVTATANATYKAYFEKIPVVYTINVSVNGTNGTATASSNSVPEGQSVTLTATPMDGYRFVNWTLNDNVVSTDATYTFTPTASGEYVANFEQDVVVEPEVPSTSPEDGKAYIIRNVHPNGNKYMLVDGYSSGTPVLPEATDGAAADYSNVFICRAIDVNQNKYAFVNAKNGKFMAFHGKSDNHPFTSDGFYSTYDKTGGKCDFIITKYATKPGHYSISGLRNRPNDDVGGWATMTIATSGAMDANSGVHNVAYSGTFSSLFTFTEVLDYPNKVTLAQIDPAKDELIYGIKGSIGTFSAPYATVLPKGVKAYYAQKKDANVLHLTPLNATTEGIPANEGVILVGGADAESKVRMIPATTEWVEAISDNAFSNTAAGSVVMQTGDYVLARGEQGIGFYQATGTLKPNKAYLSLSDTSNVAAFRLVFGETTDLNSTVTIINPDAPIYDLSGRRVMQTVKGGVYIQNGKKFIVK